MIPRMLVYIKAVNLYKHWGKYLVLPFNLESAMHSTRIIVFFLVAFKIASCLDSDCSIVHYVNWYVLRLPIFASFWLMV